MSDQGAQLPVTSSQEPQWVCEAQECYRAVILALQQGGIPFVVGGGFAFHMHTGIWRTTKDMDLVLVPGAVPAALEKLREAGFETSIEDPVWLAKVRRGEYYVDLITGAGNATLPADESWIKRGIPAEVLGFRCTVLPAEELIASKIFVTRRERFDGADIAHLVKARGGQLDWDRLMNLAEPHKDMLFCSLVLFAYVYPAHTDVVPQRIWDELTEQFKQHVDNPQKDAPFRGSLVDPKMFAIDVDEWGERDLYQEHKESYPGLLQTDQSSRSEL